MIAPELFAVSRRFLLVAALLFQDGAVLFTVRPRGPHALAQAVRQGNERYHQITFNGPIFQQLWLVTFWILEVRIDLLLAYKWFLNLLA